MKKVTILAFMPVLTAFLFTACINGGGSPGYDDGVPPGKTNMMPFGEYAGKAGTLTFDTDDPVAPSSDGGYVHVKLAPDYLYLLGGQENNGLYRFRLDDSGDEWDVDWDGDLGRRQWYVYYSTDAERWEDIEEIRLFTFIWNAEGWDTGGDEVVIEGAEADLILRYNGS